MFNTKMTYLTTLVFIVLGLFACNLARSGQKESENSFQAIPAETVSIINGVKIKYTRDDRGCINSCQFWNDPARCGDNAECCKEMDGNVYEKCMKAAKETEAGYTDCIPAPTPKIGRETVVSAGNTTDTAQVCNEFRIVTHGSPGWSWSCVGGHCTVACLGYLYDPWCCQYYPSVGWQCAHRP